MQNLYINTSAKTARNSKIYIFIQKISIQYCLYHHASSLSRQNINSNSHLQERDRGLSHPESAQICLMLQPAQPVEGSVAQ